MQTTSVSVDLPIELAAKLRHLALAQGRSASSLIVEAAQFAGEKDIAEGVILRRLDYLEARIESALRGDVEIKEILLWFVRIWLEHNPPIEEDLPESAAESADERFELFLRYVADSLNAGPSVARFPPAITDDGRIGTVP